MKIVKIKARFIIEGPLKKYVYPEWYDASKINVLCYESFSEEGKVDIQTRGAQEEYLIATVDDEYGAIIVKEKDCSEMQEEEAIEVGSRWRKQIVKINDESSFINIISKNARGIALTEEEKKSLDPDDPTPGIGKSKSFRNLLKEVKQNGRFIQ